MSRRFAARLCMRAAALLVSCSLLTGCAGGFSAAVSDAAEYLSAKKLGASTGTETSSGYVQAQTDVKQVTDQNLTEADLGDPVEGTSQLGGFAYSQLDPSIQEIYAQLYTGIAEQKAEFTINAGNTDDIKPALSAIMTDCPEFFWIDGTASMSGFKNLGIWRITLNFTIDPAEIASAKSRIEAKASEYLNSIPQGASDYDKVKLAYEFIIGTTDYSLGSAQNQNIMSVFLNGMSVCAGYARAFKYLLDRAGVWCAYVEGTISDTGEGHAWNLVRMDGVYSYVDPSWGDPTYGEDNTDAKRLDIIYDYLCLTADEMLRAGHIADDTYTFPECTDMTYDYYILNGMYHTGYSEDEVSQVLWNAVDNGVDVVYYKFADFESYQAALDALFPPVDSDRESLINAPIRQRMKWDETSSMRYYYSTSDSLRIIRIYW